MELNKTAFGYHMSIRRICKYVSDKLAKGFAESVGEVHKSLTKLPKLEMDSMSQLVPGYPTNEHH